jgi:16S rRNA (uracil1498-N3)-methyltransferase
MHRFFLSAECFTKDEVHFGKEMAHQIAHVLRLEPGQVVIVLDNHGSEYDVTLNEIGLSVTGTITGQRAVQSESAAHLALYLGLTQREKFEWMLQKCTEVGVSSFTPVITRRSLVQDINSVLQKYERWGRIIREAAEQAGRGVIPTLQLPLNYKEAILDAKKTSALVLLAWESEQQTTLTHALKKLDLTRPSSKKIACLIGPEGGYEVEEVSFACDAGALPVTLSQFTLRMETAAVVAAALIMHELVK